MKAIKAKKIMLDNHLISGKISQGILKAIIHNEEIPGSIILSEAEHEKIKLLQKRYNEKMEELRYKQLPSRNYPFYLIAQDIIQDFSFKESKMGSGKFEILAHRVSNLRPSLLSLLLGQVDPSKDTWLHRHYEDFSELPNEIITPMAAVLQENHITIPPEVAPDNLIEWLQKGIRGEPLNIVMSICPDYGVIETGNKYVPYQYTFSELGTGIGLVGQRAIKITHALFKLFNQLGFTFQITLAMADFEAFDINNLRRLNVTEDEFIERLQISKEAIKSACPQATEVTLFTSLCKGKDRWLAYQKDMQQAILQVDYDDILQARKPLYRRWLGENASETDFHTLMRKQATDYATKGMVLAKHVENVLVIGLDHVVMAPFLNVCQEMPILYVKPYYE